MSLKYIIFNIYLFKRLSNLTEYFEIIYKIILRSNNIFSISISINKTLFKLEINLVIILYIIIYYKFVIWVK